VHTHAYSYYHIVGDSSLIFISMTTRSDERRDESQYGRLGHS
jgi:hypothetical protein